MSERLKTLREKRGKIVADMRAITDAAQAEARDLSNEELAQHGTLFDEQRKVGQQIEAEERQIEADRAAAARDAAPEQRGSRDPETRGNPRASEEYRASFERFLRGGVQSLTGEELRALQADSDTGGGFLVSPTQMVADLLKAVDNAVWIRRYATKHSVPTAASLGVPTLETDPDDADWTSELATGNEDNAMGFGARKLHPHPLAKRIKVSRELLRMVPGVEALVRDRLGYKFGIAQEKNFLLGDGAQKPLGVYVASASGIPTSRDVSTGNTATAITFDGLIEAKYSLKTQYRQRARWNFHRDAIKQIAKIKDSDGQYIWKQSVREGEPDTILGLPFDESEYTPNTFTTGQYVGLLGDFSFYWIADAYDLEIQRLNELYAATNQVGLIGRLKTDGQPVLAEAFARVKLG